MPLRIRLITSGLKPRINPLSPSPPFTHASLCCIFFFFRRINGAGLELICHADNNNLLTFHDNITVTKTNEVGRPPLPERVRRAFLPSIAFFRRDEYATFFGT